MACSFFNVDDIPLHTPNYNKVFVSGLCENTSDELIRLFFENQRRTGGGKIEHLNRIAETYAIIEFKYSKGKTIFTYLFNGFFTFCVSV